MLAQVDSTLADRVAIGLGLEVNQKLPTPRNMSVPADGDTKEFQSKPIKKKVGSSPAVSMANTVKDSVKTRKVAILGADGIDDTAVAAMKKALTEAGAQVKLVAPRLGVLKSAKNSEVKVDFSLLTASSVMFDAVYIPGGERSVKALQKHGEALEFLQEAFKHCKTIAANGAGAQLLHACRSANGAAAGEGETAERGVEEEGIIVGSDDQAGKIAGEFIKGIAQHRHWGREKKQHSPA
jgi:catalase